MDGKITMIVREENSSYRVRLETLRDELIGEFTFKVGQAPLEVVSWDSNFQAYIGLNPRSIPLLFKAVLAVHHAQCLKLPPWE